MLLASDLTALLVAGLAAGGLWQQANPEVDPALLYRLWPLLALFLLGYRAAGVYPGVGVGPVEELKRLTLVTTAVYLVLVFALFFAKEIAGFSRGIFLLSWLASVLLVPLGRGLVRHLFAARSWWGVPVLVLGAGKTGQLVVRRLQDNPGLDLKVLACLDDDVGKFDSHRGVPLLGPLEDATRLARELKVRHALVAMPGLEPERLNRILRAYAAVFPELIVIPDLFGITSFGISAADLGGVLGLHLRQNLLSPVNRWLKRALNVLLLVPALLLAAPLVLIAALWVMAVSPGNPFYAQRREGYRGKPIRVWKLRTMHLDADLLLERHLERDPDARLEWERFYKLRRDPRILPWVGPLLRKTSLDELPQLWNIARGEMSFVGPRPFPYYHLERFDDEFRTLRHSVLPGLTGLWQVSARSEGDLEVQRELDSYYIRNWSLWLDLYLLARTPWAVIVARGAY